LAQQTQLYHLMTESELIPWLGAFKRIRCTKNPNKSFYKCWNSWLTTRRSETSL